ncbi:electron transport complex subunit G [Bacteroidia bacterium]|nr:electron transport complex subunit G [Bacteroidia bacterium]
MKNSLKNMILTLLLISLVASAAVGLVYRVTAAPIAKSQEQSRIAALKKVLSQFDNNPVDELQTIGIDDIPLKVYTARQGGQVVGYAVETLSREGYGGTIVLMAGFRPDGEIIGIEALSHSETPGLGDKIDSRKSNFSVQFRGKNPATFRLAVKKDGGDVDAITASTISSRAYAAAVRRGYDAVMQLTKE